MLKYIVLIECSSSIPGNIITLLLRLIPALLLRNLLTDLSGLAVTLGLGHNRSHRLLNLIAFIHWNWTADRAKPRS